MYFQDCLRSCQEQIEQTLAVNLSNMTSSVEPASLKMDHTSSNSHLTHSQHEPTKEQPTTPTDVQDIHF